jgi:hypothetical protein
MQKKKRCGKYTYLDHRSSKQKIVVNKAHKEKRASSNKDPKLKEIADNKTIIETEAFKVV